MSSSASLKAAFAFAGNSDWARAVPAAREALASDPDNANAHALLALALVHLEQPREAVEAGRRAVALEPESSFAHYALGRALFEHDDAPGAERAARESLRLEPDAAGYQLLAQTFLQRSQWQNALDAATRGLEIEPEHKGCASLRARALLHMGRSEEADAAVRDSLAHDPENADAHANRGWLLLRQSKPEEALESFRAALRIDPTFAWAREGIIEALKARKGVYRVFLRYSFWMGSLSPRARWIVIIGLFVMARIARSALRENPELLPILGPALGLYFVFVLGTWIAGPLSNLLLRFHSFGRLALGRDEVMASNLIAGCLVLALVGGLMLAITGSNAWLVVAASSALLLIPIGGAFSGYGTRAWRPLLAGLVVIAACAATAMMLAFVRFDLAVFPLIGQFLGSFLFGWFANYLVIKYR